MALLSLPPVDRSRISGCNVYAWRIAQGPQTPPVDTGQRPLRLPVAVIQPLPGIGDMVWHLPHIRAIAQHAGAPVTMLTKPRSFADQLLCHEAAVDSVLWIDLNPQGRRGAHDGLLGFLRLVKQLRSRHFGSVILLHHSTLLAAAAWMAGIPDRRGYGWRWQRRFLNTGPFLPRAVARLHQHTRATRYLALAGIPLPSAEPRLTVPDGAAAQARRRLGDQQSAFVAIGIGSSEVLRQWGADRFAALALALSGAGWPMLVLLGGPEDAEAAATIAASLAGHRCVVRQALGWHLAEVAGLLTQADFYVGNTTGVMNVAAAVGTRTYALFGTTSPFDHASQIVPVTVPDTGVHDGMVRLDLGSVLAAIQSDRFRLGP
jgi:heptosyltransferase-2